MSQKKSLRRFEGYYLLDHKESPGNAVAPEGKVFESATFTCPHCHRVVLMHPDRQRPRNYCAKCDRYTCDTPACVLECRNLNALFDTMQEEAIKKEALEKLRIL